MDSSSGPRSSAKLLKSAKPAGLQLDAATLRKLKDQALAKARKLQEQVMYNISMLDHYLTGLSHPSAYLKSLNLDLLTRQRRLPDRQLRTMHMQKLQSKMLPAPGMPGRLVPRFGRFGRTQKEAPLSWQ